MGNRMLSNFVAGAAGAAMYLSGYECGRLSDTTTSSSPSISAPIAGTGENVRIELAYKIGLFEEKRQTLQNMLNELEDLLKKGKLHDNDAQLVAELVSGVEIEELMSDIMQMARELGCEVPEFASYFGEEEDEVITTEPTIFTLADGGAPVDFAMGEMLIGDPEDPTILGDGKKGRVSPGTWDRLTIIGDKCLPL